MTTVNLRVTTSLGDTEMGSITNNSGRNVTTSGTVSGTDSVLAPGSHGGNDEHTDACRFTSVTVPNAATINSAYFRLRANGTYNAGSNVIKYYVSGQAADNAAALATTSGNLNTTNRPRTTATAVWTATSVSDNTQYSTDVTSVIQEIVNRAGWASGNAIVIIIDTHEDTTEGEWQEFDAYDGSSTDAAWLDIDYTAGGSSIDGVAAFTLGGVGVVAVGEVGLSGGGITALGGVVLTATGDPLVEGVGITALAIFGMSATGDPVAVGAGITDLGGVVLAATGELAIEAVGITGFDALSLSATGDPLVEGAGITDLGALVLVASGYPATTTIEAEADFVLGGVNVVSTGIVSVGGDADFVLGGVVLTSTGDPLVIGVGISPIDGMAFVAEGENGTSIAADFVLGGIVLAASGYSVVEGTGIAGLGALVLTSEGFMEIDGSADLNLGGISLVAHGYVGDVIPLDPVEITGGRGIVGIVDPDTDCIVGYALLARDVNDTLVLP